MKYKTKIFPDQFNPLSSEIDRVWAGRASENTNRFNNYYDYYFSGEDVRIFIDGLFDPEDEIDIAQFAFSVSQEKQPLYGFWSYNYDAVMFGTRIVSGQITVFLRNPRRMTQLLEKAALNRQTSAQSDRVENPSEYTPSTDSIISRLGPDGYNSEDEKNILKYWSYSQLDRITSDPGVDNKNLFSAHPPFNFIILYGAEETALTPFGAAMTEDLAIADNLDRMIYSDVNQRTIRPEGVGRNMKTILQQVNLTSGGINYMPGGQPITETFQFIARDFYHTDVDMSFIKKLAVTNVSDENVDVTTSDVKVSTSYNSNSGTGRRLPPP